MDTRIIGLVVVLILLLSGVYYIFGRADPTILEDENETGLWGVSVEIEYEDGTTEKLGISKPGLAIEINDKVVTAITFILQSKMYGTGYNNGEVDLTDISMQYGIYIESNGNRQYFREGILADNFEVSTIPVDNQWHEVIRYTIQASTLEESTVVSSDFYTYEMYLWGAARFRGVPGGEWQSLSLPPSMIFLFQNVQGESGTQQIFCDTSFGWE